jgi:polysaccharide deacetylase 2 family uncharacterized protein YibQ
MKDDDYHLDRETRRRLEQRRTARLEQSRRLARRRRNTVIIVLSCAAVAIAVVVLFAGPLKGVIHSEGKASGKTSNGNTSKAVKPSATRAASTAPGTPVHVEKRSDTTPPAVGIVIDDVGNTTDKLPLWQAIDAPLCFAVMPYPPLSEQLAAQLFQSGYVIMMHVPTDNAPPKSFSGKGQLATGMDRATAFATLDSDLKTVPHAMGTNNHQGGRGCDQLDLMTYEVEWAKSRGMFVVDSNSSVSSKVTQACKALGLPKRRNQVFIDHDNNPDYIRKAMRELAGLARQNGTAIGICHWHRPNTAAVVGEMINTLKAEGIHFAFARDITN